MRLSTININKFTADYTFELCKANKSVLGTIPVESVSMLNRNIDDIDKITFEVYKYVYNQFSEKQINIVYDDIKEERLIYVNEEEYFVIKEISKTDEGDNPKKEVVAYSMEHKLTRNLVEIEDMGIKLITLSEEQILNISDYMYNEIGWKIGHVDDTIAWEDVNVIEKTPKVRWVDSLSKSWYLFFMEDISDMYDCVVSFNTKEKLINLYDINTVGENVNLYLSKDNYVNSLKNSSNTNDIVTRLKLVGREEMDIIGVTLTGTPYIENFSYFIENEEMSNELIEAMLKFEEMIKLREVEWKELTKLKEEKSIELTDKKMKLLSVYETIRNLKAQKEIYKAQNDTENENRVWLELSKKEDERVSLEVDIRILETQVNDLQDSIKELNILCQRPAATDENGRLIFTEELLNELNEFVYSDTYNNDAYLKEEDLLKAGKRELSFRCKPVDTFDIDLVNFMQRIIDNGFRQHFSGNLSLGDIIILYDKDSDKESFLFLTAFEINFQTKKLSLTLSSQKINRSNKRTIPDYLRDIEITKRKFDSKSYLLLNQKYNRINL